MRRFPRLIARCRMLAAGLLFVPLSFLLAGCDTAETLPPLAPVKGKVTLDGAPLTAGHVALHPEKPDASSKVPLSAGVVDSSGNYEIFTGGKPGAPLMKYKVVVAPSMVPVQGGGGPPSVPPKYMSEAGTPLSVEVVQTPKDGQYDLQLSK